MAGPVEHEFFWKIVEWVGWAVGAIATAILGAVYRIYRKDRGTLHHLKEKMEEVDRIRAMTEDGQKPIKGLVAVNARLDSVESELTEIKERTAAVEQKQDTMQDTLTEIKTDVKWLCKSWKEDKC